MICLTVEDSQTSVADFVAGQSGCNLKKISALAFVKMDDLQSWVQPKDSNKQNPFVYKLRLSMPPSKLAE